MLPDAIELGPVGLTVTDIGRSRRFWCEALGLQPITEASDRLLLGAARSPLLELVEHRGAVRDRDTAGLFHVAFLLPDRAALGHALRRFQSGAARLTGASDHWVSEALYLDDPDGHGIEIYADRPRAAWMHEGRFRIDTMPLDRGSLLAAGAHLPDGAVLPAGTRIGHVHLESHGLATSHAWYTGTLGLEIMARMPQASFLSKGGYHHHLGINAWARRPRPLELRPERVGLRYWTILGGAGLDLPTEPDLDGVPTVRDPSGIPLRVPSASS